MPPWWFLRAAAAALLRRTSWRCRAVRWRSLWLPARRWSRIERPGHRRRRDGRCRGSRRHGAVDAEVDAVAVAVVVRGGGGGGGSRSLLRCTVRWWRSRQSPSGQPSLRWWSGDGAAVGVGTAVVGGRGGCRRGGSCPPPPRRCCDARRAGAGLCGSVHCGCRRGGGRESSDQVTVAVETVAVEAVTVTVPQSGGGRRRGVVVVVVQAVTVALSSGGGGRGGHRRGAGCQRRGRGRQSPLRGGGPVVNRSRGCRGRVGGRLPRCWCPTSLLRCRG